MHASSLFMVSLLSIAVLVLALSPVSLSSSPSPSTSPSRPPSSSSSRPHAPTPLPRVSTASINGNFRFVHEGDPSDIYFPRGSNYIRLNGSQGPSGPTLPVYHATFSPRYYNRTQANASLYEMSTFGYTFTRVFIDAGTGERRDGINGPEPASISATPSSSFSSSSPSSSTPQLSAPFGEAYLENLVDFLTLASSHGVYTMITLESLPANSYFFNISGAPPAWVGFPQFNIMAPSYVRAWQEFGRLLARELKQRLGFVPPTAPQRSSPHSSSPSSFPTSPSSPPKTTVISTPTSSAIFAYSLANELCVDASQLPFSSTTLQVTTADGSTYDMSSPSSRQACADNNILYWADAVAAAVRDEDPSVMVTLGMFTFQAVGKKGPDGIQPGADPRHPARPALLSRLSSLSFLDVHIYPVGGGWTLAGDLQTEEWDHVAFARLPILMGETGAFKYFYNNSVGAAILTEVEKESCRDYFFSGWAVWTWDTWEQGGFLWTMVDDDYAIAQSFSPRQRPDPCS